MKIYMPIVYYLLVAIVLYDGEAAANARASPAIRAEEKNKSEVSDEGNYWVHGSLMFDKESSEKIDSAIKSYDQKIPLEIILPSLFPVINQKIEKKTSIEPAVVNKIIEAVIDSPKIAPAFYLKSIFYFSHDNWSLWLNNKKISNSTDISNEDVAVMDISRSQVIFLWKNSRIDRIFPNWKDNFISLGGGKYLSPEKNIVVDDATGNISFILRINQSLVSAKMQIVEGSVADSKISAAPAFASKPDEKGINPADNPSAIKPYTTKDIPVSQTLGKDVNSSNILYNIEKLKSILDQTTDTLRNANGIIKE